MKTDIFLMHTLSPLHIGVGQAVGVVDLPIMREKSTQLPIVPGSAIKGVLRDLFHGEDAEQARLRQTLFGSDTVRAGEDSQAGSVVLGDAHLLLLPVRSFLGVFAYVTCPFALQQFAMVCRRSGQQSVPTVPGLAPDAALKTSDSVLVHPASQRIFLEDLDLQAANGAEQWAGYLKERLFAQEPDVEFSQRFVIVPDDTFVFLAETATEVRARIRIDDATGVVADGALWYEENLPVESVLWGYLGTVPLRSAKMTEQDVLAALRQRLRSGDLLQIGGKATVGRGLVRILF